MKARAATVSGTLKLLSIGLIRTLALHLDHPAAGITTTFPYVVRSESEAIARGASEYR